MLNQKLQLNENVFSPEVEKKSVRDGFGFGLRDLAKENKDVVALTADLSESTRVNYFAKEFPERFFQMGVAEQNMATVAAGLAVAGKIPYASSYATFSPGRNWEQIRTTICYNNVPVKLIGAHAGLFTGPDGATHQALEDIALMRVLPQMTVFVPCDYFEAYKITQAVAKLRQPSYIRLFRPDAPLIGSENTPFEIGKANVLWEEDMPAVSIFACGEMVYYSLLAAKELKEEGISVGVINISSLKPLDEKTVLDHIKVSRAAVTVEDHQISGGLGSVIAELLAKENCAAIEFVGVKDVFAESGQPEELLDKYGLHTEDIKQAVKRALKRK